MRAGQSGRPAGTATLGAGQANEDGENSDPLVGWCVNLLGGLRMGLCRLVSAPITSATAERGGWSRHSGECSRPILTWASSRRPKSQMASTPAGRPATKSSRLMRRADSAAASHFSTASHPASRWRRWRGAGQM